MEFFASIFDSFFILLFVLFLVIILVDKFYYQKLREKSSSNKLRSVFIFSLLVLFLFTVSVYLVIPPIENYFYSPPCESCTPPCALFFLNSRQLLSQASRSHGVIYRGCTIFDYNTSFPFSYFKTAKDDESLYINCSAVGDKCKVVEDKKGEQSLHVLKKFKAEIYVCCENSTNSKCTISVGSKEGVGC